MSYRIKRRETPEQAAIRIAAEETGAALASLAKPQEMGLAEAIHDCRKRCRKLRGLIRLIPPKRAKRARRLDRLYRSAAQELSGYRDAHATLATFDRLVAASEGGDGPTLEHFDPIRLELLRRSTEASEAVAGAAEPIERAVGLLSEGAQRAEVWTASDGWSALATGLVDTYRTGASTLDALLTDPNAAAGHQLRKQAKYTWYHLRLLQRSAPSVLVPLAGAFESLVETLGDANDLDVLSRAIAADPDAFGGADVALPVAAHLDEQHRLLRAAAVSRAVRLYAERPKAFARRLGAYWDVWHTTGPERVLGPIPPIEPSSGGESFEPEPTPDPEPSSDPDPEPSSGPEPEPVTDPSSEPEPEPMTDPDPEPSSGPDPEPEPSGEAEPEPTTTGDRSEGDGRSEDDDDQPGTDDGLDELNVAGLRALAREHGLTGVSKLRRADLLAELRSSGIAAPEQV